MRKILLSIGCAGLIGCVAHPAQLRAPAARAVPQLQSGVYITADDFEAAKLIDAITCEGPSSPVDANAFARTRDVVMPGAAATPRAKAQVFGFRACDGTDVRFVGGANFRVVQAAPLYLYQHEYRVSRGKSGSLLKADFFFSTAAADSVHPLSLDALKRAYPDNHRFHDLLDLAFRTDAELTQYDEFHHEYRVARLLRQSFLVTADRREPAAY